MRRSVRGGPRVCELWRSVVVDIVEAHAAIWAVLVFHNHRHGRIGLIAKGECRVQRSARDRLC